ncbi:protease complex subunit PrcB family protein [Marinobacter lacisalsi]|uniref:Protease complex subunit PrcB family protein n=1 Tax=Marinobacter lacisalsi TaxID=475979 RepID=A0ABV8QET7_9GAMM
MGKTNQAVRVLLAGLALTAGLSACAMNSDSTSAGAPLARQITASGQCGFSGPGVVYMDSRERLETLAETRGANLVAPENHDFDREHLVLVAAGRKPTGGYGVALEDSRIRDGVLEISVDVRTPSPDQMVTQALTSPCALLAVTAEGWERVRVSGPGFDELSVSR